MAKQVEKKVASWDDFSEDNLMSTQVEDAVETNEDVQEEEEEEKVEEPVKKKAVAKPKPKAEEKVEEPEQDNEEEIEEEQDEETSEEDEKEPSAQEFFEEVEKLTGLELDVDYGDIDPLTPQGVALREKAVREASVDAFLEEIETNYPTAYKALQHAHNGGDIADLFKTTSSRDYSKVNLGENDKDLARQILTEYYQSKGVKNENKIKRMLETDEESEAGIVGEAKSALDELKAEQAAKSDEALKSQETKANERKKRDQLMISAVDEVLESGKLGNFKLAGRQEAADFKKFLNSTLRRSANEEGKYEFTTKIDSSNLEKVLQFQYFQFKQGDLSKLIQIKAATEQAKKFRLKAAAESSQKKGKGFETAGDRKVAPSMKDFDID